MEAREIEVDSMTSTDSRTQRLQPNQHAVLRTTTEQLGAVLDEMLQKSRKVLAMQHLGGRDWVVVASPSQIQPLPTRNRHLPAPIMDELTPAQQLALQERFRAGVDAAPTVEEIVQRYPSDTRLMSSPEGDTRGLDELRHETDERVLREEQRQAKQPLEQYPGVPDGRVPAPDPRTDR